MKIQRHWFGLIVVSALACTAETSEPEATEAPGPDPGCSLQDVDGEQRLFCPKPGKADLVSCSAEDMQTGCVDDGFGCDAEACSSCVACSNDFSAGGGTGWYGCKTGTASTWGGYSSDRDWAAKEAQKKARWACLADNGWFDVCVVHEPYCTPGYITGFTCKAKACRKAK